MCTVLIYPVLGKSSHSEHTLAEQASTFYGIEGENAKKAQSFKWRNARCPESLRFDIEQ